MNADERAALVDDCLTYLAGVGGEPDRETMVLDLEGSHAAPTRREKLLSERASKEPFPVSPKLIRHYLDHGATCSSIMPRRLDSEPTGAAWLTVRAHWYAPGEDAPAESTYGKRLSTKHWRVASFLDELRPSGAVRTDTILYILERGYWRSAFAEKVPIPMFLSMYAWDDAKSWAVDLRYDTSQVGAVRLLTDPLGAREVFALRDIPNGAKRRAALRHWVRGHYRQSRVDPEARSYVNKHLRGVARFSWNGLECTIRPAITELEQLARDTGKTLAEVLV